jgi:hypothetical protein
MIVIATALWERMLDAFSEFDRDLERVAYFDGVAFAEGGVATTLCLPLARSQPRSFQVPAEAMSAAGKHLRAHRMRRLAQVHTHPGDWTGHSPYDDKRAYSQRPGAISIVLPSYARNRPTLAEAGVHVRGEDLWRELEPREVDSFVRAVPSVIDLRGAS